MHFAFETFEAVVRGLVDRLRQGVVLRGASEFAGFGSAGPVSDGDRVPLQGLLNFFGAFDLLVEVFDLVSQVVGIISLSIGLANG